MEELLFPLSSRPERSAVEGSAVPRTHLGNVFRHNSAGISQQPHQVQVPFRLGNIQHDLLLQRLRRRPPPFLTKPAMKQKPQGRLLLKRNRMKVQQVRLDGKRIGPKRWPVADIGHGIEPLPAYTQLCDIHSVRRQQLPIGRQVNRRNRQRRTNPASMSRRRIDEKSVSQQCAGGTKVASR